MTRNAGMRLSSYFNSRPSARGDHQRQEYRWRGYYFNSRPSARGDQMYHNCQANGLFQFTPLREGRHNGGDWEARGSYISIHAPPRGATAEEAYKAAVKRISIHAPPRGATYSSTYCSAILTNFNSRPSARGDPSAHSHVCGRLYFNSRPSARGDGKRYAISANLLFNPYKSAWLNNSATQFVEIILVIFHRIIA